MGLAPSLSPSTPEYDHLCDVVADVDCRYARAAWPTDRIFREFGRRTLGAITASGETHYLCCQERNYVVAAEATRAGIPGTLVTLCIKRPSQPARLGTAVELTLDGQQCAFVGAITGNKLIPQVYPYRPSQIRVLKAPMRLDDSLSWFDQFGISTEQFLGDAMPGFDFQSYLSQIAARNSEEDRDRVLRRIVSKA